MTGAFFVAAGILSSRVSGLVRLRVFAHYFGLQSDAADAFNAAFRIPNLLQNLFGEGALSASFIPVYAKFVAAGERQTADRVAGAVGAVLTLAVSVLVVAGVLGAPLLTALLAPGFTGEKRALTVTIVRILFPGAGLLVISAWCLGILNSHGRFLLSYAAPVLWNVAMIVTLVVFGPRGDLPALAVYLAWGSVAGSALQVIVQVPAVWRVAPHLGVMVPVAWEQVRTVGRTFVPAFFSRGVVQISAFIDTMIATFLPTGAVTGLANAQLIYLLPISLFGMSVSAAELPAMSGTAPGADGGADLLRQRLERGLRRIAFFVVPSAAAFVAFGDVVAAALLQTGRFDAGDADYVWAILAGSSVGLLAAALARLYSTAHYAVRDTRTPLRCAIARVGVGTVLGYAAALYGPAAFGVDPRWGAAGLTAASGVAAWVELLLLRSALNRRIGPTGLSRSFLLTLWGAGLTGAVLGWGTKAALPVGSPPLVAAAAILGVHGSAFLTVALLAGIPEARSVMPRIRR